MATGELDLVVAGTHQKIAMGRSRDCNVLQRKPLVPSNNLPTQKQKSSESTKQRPIENQCDIESNSSRSSLQEIDKPVIWVDIVRKLPIPEVATPITTNPELTAPVRAPTNARPGLLPVAFQIYLQKNFSLMAEVDTAKRRRSDNRQIFRTEQEEDVNWTSNAPRPSEWQRKPPITRKKNRTVNLEKWLELTDGLEGIHLQGREPRITNPLQPCRRNPTKKSKIQNHSFDFQLEWPHNGKRVTFQPNNPGKQSNGKQRRRRRAKRKTKKVFFAVYLKSIFQRNDNTLD